MIYHLILAGIAVALTWTLACLLIPAWPAFALVWASVIIFTLAVLILFAGLIMLSTLVKDENRKNPAAMYPMSGYVVFCFFAIFISLLLNTYSALFILHLFGILFACIVGFVMRSAWKKSASFAVEHKVDKAVAVNRAETLREICNALKMHQQPELTPYISKIHLFSEKLRYAAGKVDSKCDAELDALILTLQELSEGETSNAELAKKLPTLLQKIENQLARRERLAVL
mgnify:CR=1 FL=1